MGMDRPISVCLVEDDRLVRETLAELLSTDLRLHLIGTFASAESASTHLPADGVDVIIMDISLPARNGIELVQELVPRMPDTRFLMYTMHDDDQRVFVALQAGAHGYILKSASSAEVADAVVDLMNGGAPVSASVARRVIAHFHRRPAAEGQRHMEGLTGRENEVLGLLAQGLLYKEIAHRLGISTNTVGQYVHGIYRKLHVQNRMEAVNKYLGR